MSAIEQDQRSPDIDAQGMQREQCLPCSLGERGNNALAINRSCRDKPYGPCAPQFDRWHKRLAAFLGKKLGVAKTRWKRRCTRSYDMSADRNRASNRAASHLIEADDGGNPAIEGGLFSLERRVFT